MIDPIKETKESIRNDIFIYFFIIIVFKIKKIPFREFKFKKINEETLSELFSYFILETVIIGKLAKINPFDQPAVEKVKTFTKNNLI